MNCPKLLLLTAFALLSLPQPGAAQTVAPLSADPGRVTVRPAAVPAARRDVQALLTLPFFDDFSQQAEGAPNAQNWLRGGGTLINNRFPKAPPSRNVATFDGLDQNGRPYGSSSAYSDTDTLTSQPIDLGGLTAGSGVYLSFFWQMGSIVGPPASASSSRNVALQLEFKEASGAWRTVWSQRSTADTTKFKQMLLPINQAQYLHNGFQFRFHSLGNLATTRDAWSVDYIRLDRNRTAADSSYRDIATSRPLGSLLKRYAAMPVWQYNVVGANELNDQVRTTINNFDKGLVSPPAPTPIKWQGQVQVLSGGSPVRFLRDSAALVVNAYQFPLVGNIRNAPLPVTPTAKRVRHSIQLLTNEPTAMTLANDSIGRVTELSNYYAYDDGTHEATLNLPALSAPSPASYYAYRIDLNRADQVRSLRLYPVLPNAAGRLITIHVWQDANGQPGTARATKSFTIPTALPAGQAFVDIPFDQVVPVSGTFFVGYGQPSTGQFVQFGYDMNSRVPDNYFFYGSFGGWQPTFTTPPGALMMRPVMTGVITATADARVAASFSLYPNPSGGLVQVQGTYERARVLDALGRLVWEQPAARAGQPVLDLQVLRAGVYLVQLQLPDGQVVTKRLVLSE
ncbi:T9SS type A sorting domain-containing protein [Hymenobacter sp. BT175]|uniref:T9SS type A sorting domain-containing protein n=1 Tax=Hymenobacter translucens TaxID=2886507 RepID=UPI001D0E1157|nr:T9SS type A sorting domain-containing protein [Hymenobacter translucens]MCC2545457.1 T9SS type A sorting domain-containing protein [Hymenobacter translucens]